MPVLDWLGKKKHVKAHEQVPYRVLTPDTQYAHGDPNTENMIIQGDNLSALKSLLPYYAGKVKCIYIDPPYNTGNAFTHYDDNLEHSIWLGMMYPRLVLLRELLAEDGSMWISIDAEQSHYLKVILDDIFGRKNFIDEVIWQRAYSPINLKKTLSRNHDIVLVYCKSSKDLILNKLPRTEQQNKAYKNPDNDSRGVWTSGDISVGPVVEKQVYTITTPSGRQVMPPEGYCWRYSQEKFSEMVADNRIWFGETGNNVPRIKRFLSEVKQGVTPMTIWTYQEVGHNQDAKKEVKTFNTDSVFATPKPEKLIHRILHLATNKGDLVLDSFLGSGTTAAVAHKMQRRYIGIEMEQTAYTHCVPRLQQVIKGEQGGISKDLNWQGGGGFHFYTLGDKIFTENDTINPHIKFNTLARHIWFYETKTPILNNPNSPILGICENTAYILLYNGILGDKRPNNGNVLTRKVLADITAELNDFTGDITIYGESCRLHAKTLQQNKITFKQTPYDVKV